MEEKKDDPEELDVAVIILRYMCDTVTVSYQDNCFEVQANLAL